jgi:hypothetical protein
MKTYKPFLWFFLLIAFVMSCQKERSFESGGKGTPSDGSLQSATTGDCLGSTVNGVYKKDTVLGSANYVDVIVDVNVPGSYVISTDTINNIYFRATGNFSAAGTDTVRLQGIGKPAAAGTNVFTVTYDSTQCTFSVTTLAGSGGTAVFTLAGSPGNCTPGTVSGSYSPGTALNGGDSVVVQVNVTTVGTYSIITSTLNGMTFSGSGTFASTGTQTITLVGTGTPTAAGTFNFPISAGASNCSFTVIVTTLSNDYYPRTTNSNWTYQFDNNPTDTLRRYVISATKSALGNTYNIFMENDGTGPDSSGYFRKTATGDYYQYLDIGNFFGLDNAVWGEYIFLKDYVPASSTWTSSTFTGTFTDSTGTYPISVRIKETIQQKDVSVTVQGTNYPNTIVVKEEYEYSFDAGATWTVSDVYSLYSFSRGIGMIKFEPVDSAGTIYLQELKRYQVF